MFKFIFKIIKSKGIYFFTSLLLLLVSNISSLLLISMQKVLIDNVFVNFSTALFVKTLIIIILLTLINIFLYSLNPYIMLKHQMMSRISLCSEIINKIYSLPLDVFMRKKTADFTNYILRDAAICTHFVSFILPQFINVVILFIVYTVYLIHIDYKIILFVVIGSIAIIILERKTGGLVRDNRKIIMENENKIMAFFDEALTHTRQVIAFHREKWEAGVFNKIFKNYFDSCLKQIKITSNITLLKEWCKWFPQVIILAIIGYNAIYNEMSVGTMIIAYELSSNAMDYILSIFNYVIELQNGKPYLVNIKTLLNEKEIKYGQEGFPHEYKVVELKKINFSYNSDKLILKDISMKFCKNEIIAIVGKSGSGKSTIGRLLSRKYEPDCGDILIDGIPVKKIKLTEWNKHIKLVNEDSFIFADTIKNNILLGRRDITDEQLHNICMMVELHDYIMRLPHQYDELLGEQGVTLSGGQKSRLLIARALVNNPDILILDETFSSLDAETEYMIYSNIRWYRADKITIIVTHRLSSITNADRIYVIDNGEIVEAGTHEELINNKSLYYELYNFDKREKPYGFESRFRHQKV